MHDTFESRAEAIARLQSEAGQNPPEDCTPPELFIRSIHTADAVFQPREAFSERHVQSLVAAIRSNGGKPLDPLTVWHSGKRWYVVDGHHRLAAYRLYNESGPRRPLIIIPVKAFQGSLAQAVCLSAEANSKDKLPMRQEDKSNVAWRLVCLEDEDLTGNGIAKAAGVSRRTVQSMRKTLTALKACGDAGDPIELTWLQARQLAEGKKAGEWDEDANRKQGAIWAERLGRQFSNAFASNPEAAAHALSFYSADLPRRLLETEAFQDAVEDLFIDRQREAGIPEHEIFY